MASEDLLPCSKASPTGTHTEPDTLSPHS
jgi:hypothetical protein